MPKTEDSKTPKTTEELQAELLALQTKLEEETKIRESVIADPDFQTLLQAKQRGEKFSLQVGEKEQEVKERPSMKDKFGVAKADEQTDVNELDNKGMLALLADAMEDFVGGAIEDAVSKSGSIVDDKLKSVIDSQTKIKEALVTQAKNTGSAQMSQQHPDFGKYQNEAWKLVQTKGLSLEEAYLLAKATKQAETGDVDTEQPNVPPTRGLDLTPRRGAERDGEQRTNRRSSATTRRFRESINLAFDRTQRKASL